MGVERDRAEIPKENVYKKATYGDEGQNIPQGGHVEPERPAVGTFRVEHLGHGGTPFRYDHVIEVYHVHEEQIASHHDHVAVPTLQVLPDQQKEWRDEVPEYQNNTDVIPSRGVPKNEIARLFGNIGVPIQKILIEGDVSPKHRESEHQFSHEMIVLWTHYGLQVSHSSQHDGHNDDDRHSIQGATRKDIDAPHGREPLVIEGLDDVDREKSQDHRKYRHAPAGVPPCPLETACSGIRVVVLVN